MSPVVRRLGAIVLASSSAWACGPALAQARYTAVRLVDARGHDVQATAISPRGIVVGVLDVNGDEGDGQHRAFIDDRRRERDFGHPSDAMTYPTGVNDAGDVVGARNPSDRWHAFVSERGRGLLPLVPGPAPSQAWAVNSEGTVTLSAAGRAYTWRSGVFTEIVAPAGVQLTPVGLSDSGLVVGERLGTLQSAFTWRDGVLATLPGLPGTPTDTQATAVAANADGVVVGNCMLAGYYHPCRWVGGVVEDLGLLPGGNQGYVGGINARGEITGYGFATGPHAFTAHPFLWKDGVMTDLRTLVTLPPHQALSAGIAIDDRGEILARGYEVLAPDTFAYRYYLLVPKVGAGAD